LKLFHGSNIEINEIDLSFARKFKDFGQGFYLTTIEEQAKKQALRTVKRHGGEGEPYVTTFEFDETELANFKTKIFPEASDDWAMMIINNRNKRFTDFDNPLSNHDNKYDIMVGPVANDDVARVFALYTQEIIKMEQLKETLEYKKDLNNQYSFHTEQAIKTLTKIGAEKLD